MLSDSPTRCSAHSRNACLNVPYGAPCFLTEITEIENDEPEFCLNAPYGAPRFLTNEGDDMKHNVFEGP